MNTTDIKLPIFASLMLTFTLSGCLSGSDNSEAIGGPGPDPTNQAPSISGNPSGAVRVSDQYMFAPAATDADDDPLTFLIQNMPGWASFNTSNGELSGIPELGNIGTYPGIVITVSDDQAQTSLGSFTIEVTQVGTGSTTLTWAAPMLNDDGTTLTDLAGYKLYYGQSSGAYGPPIEINNVSVTTYVVDGLVPNTYYFAATAFNTAGVESRFSGEAIKVVTSN
jgi:hypothetical protein